MADWQIIPYTSRSGRSPVTEYLEDISVEEVARIEVALDLLAEFGIQLGMPHVRPVTRELWELRIRGKTQHRILYVTVRNRHILLLHAFTKKTQTTPARAIKVALERLADYQNRNAQ